jgi:uridine phosphorylase
VDRVDLPLLEDDLAAEGVVTAARTSAVADGVAVPERAVLCWFPEVLAALAARPDARALTELVSESGRVTVWEIEHRGVRVAAVNPGVGAPMAAISLEELVALGARGVVACGGAGALVPELVLGHAVVVESAVRDEGTSFHYLPPSRTLEADPDVVDVLVGAAHEAGVAHLVGRTWTTDALFRETRERTARRVAEGCVTVEMEASALIAVSRRLGVRYGHLLMAADSLAGEDWDHRGWTTAGAARAALFDIALDAAARLGS